MVQLGDIPNEAEERGAIQKERAFEDRGTGIRVLGGALNVLSGALGTQTA